MIEVFPGCADKDPIIADFRRGGSSPVIESTGNRQISQLSRFAPNG
jgi:hypothetical protein